MLSALILKAETPMALATSLSSLVPGAVEGLVREVVVLDVTADDVRRVADHAGCRIETMEGLIAQAERIKGDWILLVEAGERLYPGWIELAGRHMADEAGAHPAAGRFRAGNPRPVWHALFRPRRGALLVPKAALVKQIAARRSLGDMARGLTVRRLRLDRD